MARQRTTIDQDKPKDIDSLPAELLEEIFRCCIEANTPWHSTKDTWRAERRSISTSITPLGVPKWITLTYVCRRWRRVALRNPLFWLHIPTTISLPWVNTYLARSRNQPLTIDLDVVHIAPDAFSSLATAVAPRLKALYLGRAGFDHSAITLERYCAPLASVPMPKLETLVLDISVPNCELLDTLFASQAPRLRRLWLGPGVSVRPISTLLPNLRYLKLQTTLSVPELLSIVNQTPLLETLYVGDLLISEYAFRDIGTLPRGARVNLAHLAHLTIKPSQETHPAMFIDVFERLVLPATVHVDVSMTIEAPEEITEKELWIRLLGRIGMHLDLIQGCLKQLYIDAQVWNPRSLTVACYPASLVSARSPADEGRSHLDSDIVGWTGHGSCNNEKCAAPFHLHVTFLGPGKSVPLNDLADLLDRLTPADMLNLEALRLSLTITPFLGADALSLTARVNDLVPWRRMFRGASMTVLKVSKYAVVGALRALIPEPEPESMDVDDDDDEPKDAPAQKYPPLPFLETLVVDSSMLGCNHWQRNQWQSEPLVFPLLRTVLGERMESGLALKTLVLQHCECGRQYVDSLSAFAKNVVFNNGGDVVEREL